MKLRYHFLIYLILFPFVFLNKEMAYYNGCPWYNHFTYMLTHSSVLHYALNGLAWIFFFRITSPFKIISAILFGAIGSYILPIDDNTVGWSAVIFYLYGIVFSLMRRSVRIKMIILILISFFIPGIASLLHMYMLICGFITSKLIRKWERTL